MTSQRDLRFDVVIPAHNAASTITEAVLSVLSQRLPPRTVTVVADRCTDDTARRAAAAGASVIVSERGTPGGARNVGTEIGSADWIACLDADDIWRPSWLESVAATVARGPAVDVCFGTVEVVDATGASISGPLIHGPFGKAK